MSILTLSFGFFALGVGAIILRVNPRRRLNQMLFAAAFVQFVWILCVYEAIVAGSQGKMNDVTLWLKLNAAISAFFPLGIWLTKELAGAPLRQRILERSIPWFAAGLLMCAIVFHESFLTQESQNNRMSRGEAYYIYQTIAIPLYISLVISTSLQTRQLHGMQKIENQFFSFNLSIGALAAAMLTTLGNFLDSTPIKRLSAVVIFTIYAVVSWAITTYKIFDFHQVFTSLIQRICLIVLLSIGAISSIWSLDDFIPSTKATIISIFIFASIAFWLDRRSRSWLDLDGERHTLTVRKIFIDASLKEGDSDKLESTFIFLLKRECQTDEVKLLFPESEGYISTSSLFTRRRPGHRALCDIGWATPESLERRRSDPALADLHHFLIENSFGAIVVSPRGGRQPSLLVALGQKPHSWPFTYPEIQRIQSIAELIDGILARSRLATQAAVQAKNGQLEIMSRGLAHDLRNLITPVSSFLIHTQDRFAAGTPEADVHFAAKKSVHVMNEYIREALFFSKRLSPNFSALPISRLLEAVKELTVIQARQRGVGVTLRNEHDSEIIGDFVLLQRLLVNLVSNAIDASASGQCVRISAESGEQEGVVLKIRDEGCGIAPENIGRIFEAYFTTKDSGTEVRGFGLGLTICRKIADLHGGSIAVDSKFGDGATFTLTLPAKPSVRATVG